MPAFRNIPVSSIVFWLTVALPLTCQPVSAAGSDHRRDNNSQNEPAPVRVIRIDAETSPPMTFRIQAGTAVILEIMTSKPAELHLHGYDLVGHAENGKPARLLFRAEHTGRFSIVAHSHDKSDILGRKERPVAYIEIRR